MREVAGEDHIARVSATYPEVVSVNPTMWSGCARGPSRQGLQRPMRHYAPTGKITKGVLREQAGAGERDG